MGRHILTGIKYAFAALITVSLVYIAFFKDNGNQLTTDSLQPSVTVSSPVITAQRADVVNEVETSGSIGADPAGDVKATAAGTIASLKVKVGDTVAEGQAVATIKVTTEPDPQLVAKASQPDENGNYPAMPQPTISYKTVTTKLSGTVATLPLIKDQSVEVGAVIATVSPGTLHAKASLTQEQRFRLLTLPATATVDVKGGPAPFECTGLKVDDSGDSGDAGGSPGGGSGGPYGSYGPYGDGGGGAPVTGSLICAVPADAGVFPGLSATMTINAGKSTNVLTLPVTAVAGNVKKGKVWLATGDVTGGASQEGWMATEMPAPEGEGAGPGGGPIGQFTGEPEMREVQLGLTDGKVIEITGGLTESDQVLEFAPGERREEDFGPYGPGGPYGPYGG